MSVVEHVHHVDCIWAVIPRPGPWANQARCRTAPPELFFPSSDRDAEPARRLCARCPVVEECRAYGLAHPALQGIFGGLTADDRRRRRGEPAPAPVVREERDDAGTPVLPILELLVEFPGTWARVARYPAKRTAATVASQLRTGRRPTPPGRWEFEGRRSDTGGSDLYARWLGGVS